MFKPVTVRGFVFFAGYRGQFLLSSPIDQQRSTEHDQDLGIVQCQSGTRFVCIVMECAAPPSQNHASNTPLETEIFVCACFTRRSQWGFEPLDRC